MKIWSRDKRKSGWISRIEHSNALSTDLWTLAIYKKITPSSNQTSLISEKIWPNGTPLQVVSNLRHVLGLHLGRIQDRPIYKNSKQKKQWMRWRWVSPVGESLAIEIALIPAQFHSWYENCPILSGRVPHFYINNLNKQLHEYPLGRF